MASRQSSKSSSSKSGLTHSSTASAAAIARAKAEAAKVRASYASKEAKLKMEKAAREAESLTRDAQNQLERVRIDAEIEVLNLQREADAAIAEADALENPGGLRVLDTAGESVSERVKEERIKEYVDSQNDLQRQSHPPNLPASIPSHTDAKENQVKLHLPAKEDFQLNPTQELRTHNGNSFDEKISSPIMNADASPYTPRYIPSSARQPDPEPVALYLARRDLVNSGLYQYDDKPENYRAWYSSFSGAVNGLQLTSAQELDLMTKWLGKDSSELVKRIRSVHVNNPRLALIKAWERLQESYAAPEILENLLFQRLERFPKITAKDNIKLRELGDLLQEIEGAKEDGYLTGLTYLDTPRGIAPIVEKLPFGLQERWVSIGSFYKEENFGRFPPFEHFCKFVCHEAKKRNDPSFMCQSSPTTHSKPAKYTSNHFIPNKPVSVHKTNVSITNTDPNKNCPLHNKPHPLKKCRMFRNKPYSERRTILKEKGICFKCCSSTSHLAKACMSAVKCSECSSSYHDAAMHPDSSYQTIKAPSTAQEDGGEGEEQTDAINTSCTEVCGPGQWNRSCSKICLTKIYPKGAQDKAIKAYVILDDQSNRSLARSEFFELFNIESSPCFYYLKTCSGVTETSGRKAEGFQIESLDGKVVICLPPLLECNDILNNRSEIPTPSAIMHQPHLRDIAKHVPDLDPDAKILLLLGRDVIRAHKVREQINGPHNAPFAQRLDLGWVVVGDVCLGNVHKPMVKTFKTNVLENGRPSIFQPCTSFIHAREARHDYDQRCSVNEKMLGQSVFIQTEHDNKNGCKGLQRRR
ncbi:uncharacterized protein LOC114846700 isoform X1 [Betta splendens]|uniref:Uncharacterized protein LOC114846700 isoform X1 n=1 Tax=Betta splendens TaxID=158456 RepID=A0A6P7LBM1_BETSP|nr:uncharacterized protein LOC114846700 isoform X1 [Betta splendens]